jgi:hypothetical protein
VESAVAYSKNIRQTCAAVLVNSDAITDSGARGIKRFNIRSNANADDYHFRCDDLASGKMDASRGAFTFFDAFNRYAGSDIHTVRTMLRLIKARDRRPGDAGKNPV